MNDSGTRSHAEVEQMSASSAPSVVLDAHRLLESGNARQKLEAYALLAAHCCESKTQQNCVGALLREKPIGMTSEDVHGCVKPQRLLDIVFDDLQAADRTTRLAATRLLCLAAYENLLNQDSIVQCANGFSVGWVHVFAVPEAFQERYAADCTASGRAQSERGFRAFLRSAVVNSYATVYRHVSNYYSGGCRAFVPLAWQFPSPAIEAASRLEYDPLSPSSAVADPASHLVGFYLVPRQAQFPEHDDFYSDELLGAMNAADVARIECVQRAFTSATLTTKAHPEDTVPHSRGAHRALKSALLRTLCESADTQWVVDTCMGELGDCEHVEPIDQYFASARDVPASDDTAFLASDSEGGEDSDTHSHLTWSQVLVYSCMRLNTERFVAAFGSETLTTLATMFQYLTLSASTGSDEGHSTATATGTTSVATERRVSSASYVWEAAIIGAIQRHPTLPNTLKRHAACFQRGLYQSESVEDHNAMREPWHDLLRLRLDQLQPVSWCHFLTQWRVADAACSAINTAPPRRSSVCSVSSIRQSLVAIDAHIFRNLDDLRHELPHVVRSQRRLDVAPASSVAPRRLDEVDGDATSSSDSDAARDANWRRATHMQRVRFDTDADNSSLAHYVQLFQHMQQSPGDLDRLSREQLQAKQAAAAKLLATVALNKKRLANAARRKGREMHARLDDENDKREALECERAAARASLIAMHASRHDMALRRREQQQMHDDARQQRLKTQLELEQLAFRRHIEAKQQQVKKYGPSQDASAVTTTPTRPRPPSAGTAASISSSSSQRTARRPLSARSSSPASASAAASAVSPEIQRQRAQIYGDVVSRIYLAEAARHPQPPPLTAAPPHLARRFSTFRKQSALAGTIDADVPLTASQQPSESSLVKSSSRSERKLHSTKDDSAAVTSVLTQTRTDAGVKVDALSTACTTLVMRNAALAVSERIHIPAVAPPVFAEPHVPAHAIAQQYAALATRHKQQFRERFNLKSISHRLSYTVLKQFTKIVRRDMAWEQFHDAAARANNGHPTDRVRHADFVAVAQALGIAAPTKKLLVVARRLDDRKNGFVDWDAFYAWWSAQYDDTLLVPASRA